jgi:glycosyltransferase involved in cell wall biosynthesis
MRIGIETSALSNKFTGTSRYINCLLEQLKSTEHELVTFSPKRQNYGKGYLNPLFNMSKGGIQRHLYRHLFLAEEMENERIDCGIFPNYFMPVQFNKPSIIIIHDLSFITHPQFYSKLFVYYYNKQMKETLKQNPVIVTVSENSKEQIHKHLGIKKENIFLIQAFTNFNKFSTESGITNASTPYLLYVGHVEPRKNLHFLIENFLVWKKDRNIDIRLIIAGEIWIKSSSVNRLLNKYMNHPDVTFTGYVEEDELHKLYSNAAGFVHTSFVEGFGFPVLEAMNYELPIICSQGTATEEISSPGSITINPDSNSSLIKGLDQIYSNYLLGNGTKYKINYSAGLMSSQLNTVLNMIADKSSNHFYPSEPVTINTEEAVEKTLLYASLFNSGIRKDKLFNSIFDIKTTEKMMETALNNLFKGNKISIWDNTFYLNDNKKNFYLIKNTNGKLKKSLMFLNILKKFPLVSVISFSGGTAHYGIEQHDDIDLFIICKPHCLYLVYAVIHIFSYIFGLRDTICANYLIDENNLEIKSPRDFYTAHQIISLVPYKNKSGFNKFLENNKWINNFFPNFEIDKYPYKNASKWYAVFSQLNIPIMLFYRNLYKKKISGDSSESLRLDPGSLRLHTNDHRERITSLFESEWKIYRDNKLNSSIRTNIAVSENHREFVNTGYKLKDPKLKTRYPA